MAPRTTRKMSDRHENDLVVILGGEKTRGSGSTWSDQADGHQTGLEGHYRFTWDGKSTTGKSIGVSVEMWEKITEQSRGLEPAIPLRFYADDRLTMVKADLIAVDLETFAQMQEDANHWRQVMADDEHKIRLADDGFTIQHPISERVNGTLMDCEIHQRAAETLTGREGVGMYYCEINEHDEFVLREETA